MPAAGCPVRDAGPGYPRRAEPTGRRTVLAVLCTASFLAVVDTTIVTIALPSIRSELGLSPGVTAGLAVPGGR